MRHIGRIFTLILLLCLLSVSCTPLSQWRWEQGSLGSIWPVAGGNDNRTRFLPTGHFSGKFDSLWVRSLGDKPVASLVLLDATLVYPSSKKQFRQFDLTTGNEIAHFRVSGAVAAPPLRLAERMILAVGSRGNRVASFTSADRIAEWTFRLTEPGPEMVALGATIVTAAESGLVVALEAKNGDTIWTRQFTRPIRAGLVISDLSVLVCTDQGEIYSLGVTNGKQQWVQKLNSPVMTSPTIGSSIFVSTIRGEVIALSRPDGTVQWRDSVTGPVWGGAAFADTICVVGSGANGGELVAVKSTDGQVLWRTSVHGVVRAAPIVVDDIVVAGTLRGWLYSLHRESGVIIDSTRLDGAIEQSPISDGERIYLATARGKLAAFGESFGGRSTKSRGTASTQRQ